MGYVLAARWVAEQGREEQLRKAIAQVVEPSRAEPGCIFYQANEDPEDPRVFFFYEIYRDEEAFTQHTQTPHFQQHVVGEAIPLLAERERSFYRTID